MSCRFRIAALLVLCSHLASADDAAIEIVSAYVDAYNAHDIELMMSMVADDVKWLEYADDASLSEDMEATALESADGIVVHTKDREELTEALQSYFDTFRGARSIVRSLQSDGRTVTVFEEAIWDFAGVPMSQCATAVYFLDRDYVITTVAYSSEQPCDD